MAVKKRKKEQDSYPMPQRIDTSPKEIAQTVLHQPKKKEWRYIKGKESTKN